MSTRHPDDLVAAYALDAVDDDERDAVEEHLIRCPDCRAELARHHDALAALAEPMEPPSGLWDAIERDIRRPHPVRGLAAVAPASSRLARLQVLVTAAAAALVIVVGTLAIVADRATNPSGVDDLAQQALEDDDAVEIELADDRGRRVARAAILPDGTGFLVLEDLPDLPDQRTYQLWAIHERGPISLGVLGSGGAAVTTFRLAADPESRALAISEEPAGGMPAPTGRVVATGSA